MTTTAPKAAPEAAFDETGEASAEEGANDPSSAEPRVSFSSFPQKDASV